MLKVSNVKLSKQLANDDYLDYVLVAALAIIAIFGIGMYKKFKEQ